MENQWICNRQNSNHQNVAGVCQAGELYGWCLFTHSVLEEARVQVLFEAVLELDLRRLPGHFVVELELHVRLELDLVLAGQVDVDNAVDIVANVELLARPQPVGLVLVVVLANDAPDGQVVDVHLVPVVVLDGVGEQLVLLLGQVHFAVLGVGVVALEVDGHAAEFELDAEQILGQRLVVVVDVALGAGAERQRKVRIRFLTVVVRSDRVDPQDDFLIRLILKPHRAHQNADQMTCCKHEQHDSVHLLGECVHRRSGRLQEYR